MAEEQELGLSSDIAFDRLILEAKSSIAEWYSVNVVKCVRLVFAFFILFFLFAKKIYMDSPHLKNRWPSFTFKFFFFEISFFH